MILEEKTVGEFVKEDYRFAHIFSKYGIDFCCGGIRTLTEACQTVGIEKNILLKELEELEKTGTPPTFVNQKDLKSLIDYILQTYHTFTRKQGSLLLNYTEKLLNAHADTYKEVTELKNLVTTLVEELMTHLLKEERVLFPAILAMLDDKPLPFEKSHIIHPIQAMEFEHEQAGNLLKQITSLTNHFSPPEHACTTWKVCYSTLKEFTEDLYKHIHLENNLLFTQVWSMIKV